MGTKGTAWYKDYYRLNKEKLVKDNVGKEIIITNSIQAV